MIIFFESGRLGNQLFQYAGLKEFSLGEKLVFFGCKELEAVLSSLENITILPKSRFPRGFIFFLYSFLKWLSKSRVLGSIREIETDEIYKIEQKNGLIPNVYLANYCYFQHWAAIEKINIQLRLRDDLSVKAKSWLYAQKKYRDSCDLVFIHIRRGDYINWPKAHPAVLDFSWYERMIKKIRERVENPLFLVLTDDIFYAEDLLGQQKDVLISNNDLYVDLALMSLCNHGILSASSFSWWGAWFSKHATVFNHHLDSSNIYIAPKFWVGHRQEKWYPPGFMSSWIEYHS